MDFYDLINEINETIRIREDYKEELMDKLISLSNEIEIIKINCNNCGEEIILIKRDIDELLISYDCYSYSTMIHSLIDEFLNS